MNISFFVLSLKMNLIVYVNKPTPYYDHMLKKRTDSKPIIYLSNQYFNIHTKFEQSWILFVIYLIKRIPMWNLQCKFSVSNQNTFFFTDVQTQMSYKTKRALNIYLNVIYYKKKLEKKQISTKNIHLVKNIVETFSKTGEISWRQTMNGTKLL